MSSTDLTVIEQGAYLALNRSPQETQEILRNSLGDDTLTEWDLPRVRVPSGGGRAWEIPSVRGPESTTALEGIIVFHRHTRAYWSNPDPTGEPPQCRSNNARVGVGDPGGNCVTCQFGGAGWGSGKGGRSQACKEQRILFVLPPGAFLPLVVVIPPTSVKTLQKYIVALAQETLKGEIPEGGAVTSLTLSPTKNNDGQPYSLVIPTLAGVLDPSEAARARDYAESLRPLFDAAAEAATVETNGNVPAEAVPDDDGPMTREKAGTEY